MNSLEYGKNWTMKKLLINGEWKKFKIGYWKLN